MQYRNTQTGAVIETACTVSGEHWRQLPPAGGQPAKKPPARPKKEQVTPRGQLRDSR